MSARQSQAGDVGTGDDSHSTGYYSAAPPSAPSPGRHGAAVPDRDLMAQRWAKYFAGADCIQESEEAKYVLAIVDELRGRLCEFIGVQDQHGKFTSFVRGYEIPIDMSRLLELVNGVNHFDNTSILWDIETQLVRASEAVISCFSMALEVVRANRCSLPPGTLRITARFFNLSSVCAIKQVKADAVGRFVALRGNVVRSSDVRPKPLVMHYRCLACNGTFPQILTDGRYIVPSSCAANLVEGGMFDSMGSGDQCKGRKFKPERSRARTVDFQQVKLQEIGGRGLDSGRIPRTIQVELNGALCNTCVPGDVVTICGEIKAIRTDELQGRRAFEKKSTFLLFMEAHSVTLAGSQKIDSEHDQDAISFSEKDLETIAQVALHRGRKPFDFLVASLCPAIVGNDLVKAGLLLSLFGGSTSELLDEKNHVPVRGDLHVLVVGDPGLGKSQMLKACCKAAPRGVYVCGNTTTSTGLTVTMVRDPVTKDFALEAGALVLGDQGICCIDEFDKMGSEHQALLEAMEQQSISVAKAGIVCTLSARTSILAAANPVGGHYDRSKTVSENLKMSTPLLSRFDLIYILLDKVDTNRDKMLTRHIMELHSGSHTKANSGERTWKGAQELGVGCDAEEDRGKVEERLAAAAIEEGHDLLPSSMLRKYIAYARRWVSPKLSEDAARILRKFYLELRGKVQDDDSTPITMRQLEALVRLCQARAKADLREIATADDARDVVEIMEKALLDICSDDLGVLDFTRVSGCSNAKLQKKLVDALRISAQRKGHGRFSTADIVSCAKAARLYHQICAKHDFKNFIGMMRETNYLLKKGGGSYELSSGVYSGGSSRGRNAAGPTCDPFPFSAILDFAASFDSASTLAMSRKAPEVPPVALCLKHKSLGEKTVVLYDPAKFQPSRASQFQVSSLTPNEIVWSQVETRIKTVFSFAGTSQVLIEDNQGMPINNSEALIAALVAHDNAKPDRLGAYVEGLAAELGQSLKKVSEGLTIQKAARTVWELASSPIHQKYIGRNDVLMGLVKACSASSFLGSATAAAAIEHILCKTSEPLREMMLSAGAVGGLFKQLSNTKIPRKDDERHRLHAAAAICRELRRKGSAKDMLQRLTSKTSMSADKVAQILVDASFGSNAEVVSDTSPEGINNSNSLDDTEAENEDESETALQMKFKQLMAVRKAASRAKALLADSKRHKTRQYLMAGIYLILQEPECQKSLFSNDESLLFLVRGLNEPNRKVCATIVGIIWKLAEVEEYASDLIDKTRRAVKKKKWSLEDSVFAPRAMKSDARAFYDNDRVKKKAFKIDFSNLTAKKRFVNMVLKTDDDGGEEEMKEVRQVLWSCYSTIMDAFEFYSVMGTSVTQAYSIGLNAFSDFVDDCKIVDKATCSRKDIDTIFIVANLEEDKQSKTNKANDDRALMRFEFLDCVVRIAIAKYLKSGVTNDVSDALKMLCEQNIQANLGPEALHDSNDFRRERMYFEDVDKVYFKHIKKLRMIFDVFASPKVGFSQQSLMTLEEWCKFMKMLDLFDEDFTQREAKLAFAWSQMAVADEVRRRVPFTCITFEDFMEALARVCDMKALPTDKELNGASVADWFKEKLNKGLLDDYCRENPCNFFDKKYRPISDLLPKFLDLVYWKLDRDGDGDFDKADLQRFASRG
eukprot:g5304.t1